MDGNQGSQSRTGDYFGLVRETIYFSIGQYQSTVSELSFNVIIIIFFDMLNK